MLGNYSFSPFLHSEVGNDSQRMRFFSLLESWFQKAEFGIDLDIVLRIVNDF